MGEKTCCCNSDTKIIYSCSGGSNTGQIANELAKRLTVEKVAKMSCGIAIAANLDGFINSAKNAEKNIVIDGCSVSCLSNVFKRHGIKNYNHIIISEMGIEKNTNLIISDLDMNKIYCEVKKCLEKK